MRNTVAARGCIQGKLQAASGVREGPRFDAVERCGFTRDGTPSIKQRGVKQAEKACFKSRSAEVVIERNYNSEKVSHTRLAFSRHSERGASCSSDIRTGSSCAPAAAAGEGRSSRVSSSVLMASSDGGSRFCLSSTVADRIEDIARTRAPSFFRVRRFLTFLPSCVWPFGLVGLARQAAPSWSHCHAPIYSTRRSSCRS